MKRGFKLLILSDLLIIMAFGLISPILAIFIKEDLVFVVKNYLKSDYDVRIEFAKQ